MWDGEQLLYETRYPGQFGLYLEQDTGRVPVPEGYGPNDPHGGLYRKGRYGRVAYTHGTGIDAPLGILRMDYSEEFPEPLLLEPYADWRGQYTGGAFGGTGYRCKEVTLPNWNDPRIDGQSDTTVVHCVEVDWPGPHLWSFLQDRRTSQAGPNTWWGGLIENQQDASGLMYRRNRYYDPETGQFTQEDPIGLAGGLNLYGFANGDPVGYSDPFGLCPTCLVGGGVGVGTGWALSKLLGIDYDLKDAAIDFALGAAGAGIASKLDKINDARKAAKAVRGAQKVTSSVGDVNKINHIFGQSRHNLDDVVEALGSPKAAFDAMQRGVQTLADAGKLSERFETIVRVGGHDVTVRGRVVDGVARIGTAFK